MLLRQLFFGGARSRLELVEQTGLSGGTVTNVVADLLNDGLVIEAGTEDSNGGRPRTILEIAGDRAVVVGVDVGETRVRVEAFDLGLHKLGAVDRLVGVDGPASEVVVTAIGEAISDLRRKAGVDGSPLAGVGVGVSGIVDDTDGLIYSASIGWDGVPFAAMLRRELEIPVRIDNGAKTLGQAEMWFGAGRGARNAAVALLGTGVGAAVFADGQLYRGAHSSAGEWGHVPIVVGGRACRCGSRGCLEAYVGGWAIAERWRDAIGGRAAGEEQTVAAFGRAIGVDPRADPLADELAEHLGAGFGTLVNLFNPERIVVAGWVGLTLGPALLDRVRDHTRAHALRRPFEQVEIVMGELGPDAVALGAATLVVDGILAGDLTLPRGGRRRELAVREALSV
jgi:predicted NBD/HSP70 family sugar kinase